MFKFNIQKNKYYLIIVAVVLLFSMSSYAKAIADYQFQVKLPVNLDNVTSFGDLANRLITLSYRLAMLFALYKIIEIGFKYMVGSGKADVMVNVSKGMKNVLFGILILFGSYIILYTINPDLTKFPENLNCPDGTPYCASDFNKKVVSCVIHKDDLPNNQNNQSGTKASYSTADAGVAGPEIEAFIGSRSNKFYASGDWEAAKKDLLTGKVSNNIYEAIKAIQDGWIAPSDCSPKLEFGPIFSYHEKASDKSCHDTHEAIDIVVRDKNGSPSATCMINLMNFIKKNLSSIVVACDEIKYTPPHIHMQDIKCTIGCRTN